MCIARAVGGKCANPGLSLHNLALLPGLVASRVTCPGNGRPGDPLGLVIRLAIAEVLTQPLLDGWDALAGFLRL